MKHSLNKVLLTGATGFIGSHIANKLIQKGIKLGIIKRKSSSTWRIAHLLNKVKVYDVDLKDTEGVAEAVNHFKPDCIFHLAGYYAVEHRPHEVSRMIDANVLGAINLLEASNNSAVRLFVNTSSCFVYKESKNKLRENNDLNPLNLYAMTKINGETACSFYAEKYGLSVLTLRIFPPYGPADNERKLIPHVIKRFLNTNSNSSLKLTSGKQKWDFIYVDDVVDAYLKTLSLSDFHAGHEIFNVGNGNPVSIREVVSLIRQITGSELKPDWGAIPHRKNELWFACADIGKTTKNLNWAPQINIERGLQSTISWYKDYWKRGSYNGCKN